MEPNDLKSSNYGKWGFSSSDDEGTWVDNPEDMNLLGSVSNLPKQLYKSTIGIASNLLGSSARDPIENSATQAEKKAQSFKELNLDERNTGNQYKALRKASANAELILKKRGLLSTLSDLKKGVFKKPPSFAHLAGFVHHLNIDQDLKKRFEDFQIEMFKYLSDKGKNNNMPPVVIDWLLLTHFSISTIPADPERATEAIKNLLNPAKWVEGIYKNYGKEADQLVIGFILDFPLLLNLAGENGTTFTDEERIQAAKDYAFLLNLTQSALPTSQRNELITKFQACKESLKNDADSHQAYVEQIKALSVLAQSYRQPHPMVEKSQQESPVDINRSINKVLRDNERSQVKSTVVTLFNELDNQLTTDKFFALRTLLQSNGTPGYDELNDRLDLLQNQLRTLLLQFMNNLDEQNINLEVQGLMNFIFAYSGFSRISSEVQNPIPQLLKFLNDDKALFPLILEGISKKFSLKTQEICSAENLDKFNTFNQRLEAFLDQLPEQNLEQRLAFKFQILRDLCENPDLTATQFLSLNNTEQTERLFHPILIALNNVPRLQLIISLRNAWGLDNTPYNELQTQLDAFSILKHPEDNDSFKHHLFGLLSDAVWDSENPMQNLTQLLGNRVEVVERFCTPIIRDCIAKTPHSVPPKKFLKTVSKEIEQCFKAFGLQSHPFHDDLAALLRIPLIKHSEPMLWNIVQALGQPNPAASVRTMLKGIEGEFFRKTSQASVTYARSKIGQRDLEGATGAFGMWFAGQFDKLPRVDQPKPVQNKQLVGWMKELDGDPITDFICIVKAMNLPADEKTVSSYFDFYLLVNTIFTKMGLNTNDEKRIFLANLVAPGGANTEINSDKLPETIRDIKKSDAVLKAMVTSAFPEKVVSDDRTIAFLDAVTNIAPIFSPDSNLVKINQHIVRILAACPRLEDKSVVHQYLQNLLSTRVEASDNNPEAVFIEVLTALYYLDDLEPLLKFFRAHPDVLEARDPLEKLSRAVHIMTAISRQEKNNETYLALFEELNIQIKLVKAVAGGDDADIYWIRRRVLDCEKSLFEGTSHNVLADFTMAIGRVNLSLQLENYLQRAIDSLFVAFRNSNDGNGGFLRTLATPMIGQTQKWTEKSKKLQNFRDELREPLVDLIGTISTKELVQTILDEFSADLVFGIRSGLQSLSKDNNDLRRVQIEKLYGQRSVISKFVYERLIRPIIQDPIQAEINNQSLVGLDIERYLLAEENLVLLKTQLGLNQADYRSVMTDVAYYWSQELAHYARAKPKTQSVIIEYWEKSIDPNHSNDRIVDVVSSLVQNYVNDPIGTFMDQKYPLIANFAKNWIKNLVEENLKSSLEQLLQSGHDGWLLLGLLEPFIPSEVPLPVSNGGAPKKPNPYENPKLQAVCDLLTPLLLDVIGQKADFLLSLTAKAAQPFGQSVVSPKLFTAVFAPLFQGLESINIPQTTAQLARGLAKPPFPDQNEKLAFDRTASGYLRDLIELKNEIITLEREKPEGWENDIQTKKEDLHTKNALLEKMLKECNYSFDDQISKTYQAELVTDPVAQKILHDALSTRYLDKLDSLQRTISSKKSAFIKIIPE